MAVEMTVHQSTAGTLPGRKITREIRRSVRPLGFLAASAFADVKARRQFAAVAGLTQSRVDHGPWYLQEDEDISVLFDIDRVDEYYEALRASGGHVENIYLPLPDDRAFRAAKERLLEVLPPFT